MIIYLALEPLEQRYNVMMNEAIRPHVDIVIEPYMQDYDKIETGQFLDVTKTIEFKAKQLQIVSAMFTQGKIQKGDTFLIGDIFFPGIESIRYMAELQGIEVKMYGFNYAGRSDAHDFVQQLGMWSDYSEIGYHLCMDGVFVGSLFHRQNVISWIYEKINRTYHRCYVTGYIYDREYIDTVYKGPFLPKEDYVIWPHRLANEKGLVELEAFIQSTKRKIVITTSGKPHDEGMRLMQTYPNVIYLSNLKKWQYYEIMSRAKYYLSTAYQETFGYTLQEAIHFKCRIAVPRRACYPEMVPNYCLYTDLYQIENCWRYEPLSERWTEIWNHNIEEVIRIIKS